jgi:transcriptional regulator with XRE-family HTH domain
VTLTELRRDLRKACRSKTQKAFARELGVSLSYLNEVIGGRKEPGRKILTALGLQRQMVYVPRGANK